MEGMDIVMGTPSFVLSTLARQVLNLEVLWETETVVETVADEETGVDEEDEEEERAALGEDLAPRLEDLNSA